VLFAAPLKYVLVELKATTAAAALETLSPDFAAMQAASTDSEIVGVIVSLVTGDVVGAGVSSCGWL